MKIYNRPKPEEWAKFIERPRMASQNLEKQVYSILRAVEKEGDSALYRFSAAFDGVELQQLYLDPSEIAQLASSVSLELRQAIELAANNIRGFHQAQARPSDRIETSPGVWCWRRQVGIDKVGLYIPGGSAPLFSSLLMLAIPAQLAGCSEIVVCTPPQPDGSVHPALAFTAQLLGINRLYTVGGAQAIAAMRYGTESIPAVYKIFGPGNQYVTKAKELVQLDGVAIDMPAGPSELLLIADQQANPAYVAADLLSQAEHGPDSQVVLLCSAAEVAENCLREIVLQVDDLPRSVIAKQALLHSHIVVLDDLETCLRFSNAYAPEHLILAVDKAEELSLKVRNAGSVFLGNYSCESLGDYASGTNHTLPTYGLARAWSGVSLDSFCKNITFQEASASGIRGIGSAVSVMAEAEGLIGHQRAVEIRLKDLANVR